MDAPSWATSSRGTWWWVPGAITVITIASVIVVTLSQLDPHMLLTNTTTTGGDTGAHIAMPKYLESLVSHGHLTGWDPGWYDGFPLYTFYFTIPDLFIAIGGWIIPYGVAFKLGTDSRFGHAADLRLGVRPFLPAPGTSPDPAGRGHPPVPVRLHLHHLRREPVLDLGGGVRLLLQPVVGGPCFSVSSPAPSGRGGTAAGPPSCWPAVSSPTSFPACTPSEAPSS